jgi:hypothetical protein
MFGCSYNMGRENKEYIQNFCGELSWNAETWDEKTKIYVSKS